MIEVKKQEIHITQAKTPGIQFNYRWFYLSMPFQILILLKRKINKTIKQCRYRQALVMYKPCL